jgi:hypothetical protein
LLFFASKSSKDALESRELRPDKGAMSTVGKGDAADVFAVLQEARDRAAA